MPLYQLRSSFSIIVLLALAFSMTQCSGGGGGGGDGGSGVKPDPTQAKAKSGKSIYVMLKNGSAGDVYSFNIPTSGGTTDNKSISVEKDTSSVAKASPMGSIPIDKGVSEFDVSEYQEIVASRPDGVALADPKTDAEGTSAIMVKGKMTNGCNKVVTAEYDRKNDDVVYVEASADGTGRLKSRTMTGTVTTLYEAEGLVNTGRIADADTPISLITKTGVVTFDRKTRVATPVVEANDVISVTRLPSRYNVIKRSAGAEIIASPDFKIQRPVVSTGATVKHIFNTPDELVQFLPALEETAYLTVQDLATGTETFKIGIGDEVLTDILRRSISTTGGPTTYAVLNNQGQMLEIYTSGQIKVIGDVGKTSSTKSKGFAAGTSVTVIGNNTKTGQALIQSGSDVVLVSTTDGKELDRVSDISVNSVPSSGASNQPYYVVTSPQAGSVAVGVIGGENNLGLDGGKIAPAMLGSVSGTGAVVSAVVGDMSMTPGPAVPPTRDAKVVADSDYLVAFNPSFSNPEDNIVCVTSFETKDSQMNFTLRRINYDTVPASVTCDTEGTHILYPSTMYTQKSLIKAKEKFVWSSGGYYQADKSADGYDEPIALAFAKTDKPVNCTVTLGYADVEGPDHYVSTQLTMQTTKAMPPVIGSIKDMVIKKGESAVQSVLISTDTTTVVRSYGIYCTGNYLDFYPNNKHEDMSLYDVKSVDIYVSPNSNTLVGTMDCTFTLIDNLGQKSTQEFKVTKQNS